jgi:hypothetical protein
MCKAVPQRRIDGAAFETAVAAVEHVLESVPDDKRDHFIDELSKTLRSIR